MGCSCCSTCSGSCQVDYRAAATYQQRSRLAMCLARKQAASLLQLQLKMHTPAGAETGPRWAGHSTPEPATHPSKSKQGRWGWGGIVLPWNYALRCAADCGLRRRRRRRAGGARGWCCSLPASNRGPGGPEATVVSAIELHQIYNRKGTKLRYMKRYRHTTRFRNGAGTRRSTKLLQRAVRS